MNSNFSRLAQTNLSNLGCLLSLVLIAVGLSAVGLGWVLNGIFILIGLVALLPFVAVAVISWWVRRNIITGACPVCAAELTGLNNTEVNCANCGTPLEVRSRQFQRVTPPGTVDVEAVTVDVVDVDSVEASSIKAIEAEIVED